MVLKVVQTDPTVWIFKGSIRPKCAKRSGPMVTRKVGLRVERPHQFFLHINNLIALIYSKCIITG